MMNETTARRLWDFTRGLAAYSLPMWARDDLVARRKNQYATRYVFRDGSAFIQYRDYGHRAYTSPDGRIMGAYTRNGATPVFCRDSFEMCRDSFARDRAAGLIYMAHVRDDGSFYGGREAWSAETGHCAYCGAVANP